MNHRIVAAIAAAAVVLAISGCGDTDDDGAAAEQAESSPSTADQDATGAADDEEAAAVTVEAHDISFPEDTYSAAAGTVAIEYVNEGAIPHTLVIEDVDGFKLEVAASGDVDEGSVDLEAGDYTLYCDIPGHRDAGMEATLEVA